MTIQTIQRPWKELTSLRLQRTDFPTALRHAATRNSSQQNGSRKDVITKLQPTKNVTAHHCATNEAHNYYIRVDLKGRLGNQMFQYATLQGLARRTHHTPIIFCSRFLTENYPFIATNCISPKDFLTKYPKNNLCTIKLNGQHSCMYETALVASAEKAKHRNIHINQGYLQSWKYFRNATHIIQQHFQFDPNVLSFATKYLESLIDQFEQSSKVTGDVTAIGVHVRRGDFMKPKPTKRGLSMAPVDYFHAAMNYFRKQYTNCVFLVASDDVKWCRENLMAQDVIMIADNKFNVTSSVNVSEVQRDMSILRLVEHNIISGGTFSWWIGWFTPGQVVYCKKYARKDSLL